MRFISWMQIYEIEGGTVATFAKILGTTYVHIYQYLYEEVIPRKPMMRQIFFETEGKVSANDFYETTPEELERELLRRKNLPFNK